MPISILETSSQTAYFYNHHVRDIGNFTVVGPTGSGKTVFLSFISAQTLRISPRPKLVYIDKDRGAEIFIRAIGGRYEVLTRRAHRLQPADAARHGRQPRVPVPALQLHAEASQLNETLTRPNSR